VLLLLLLLLLYVHIHASMVRSSSSHVQCECAAETLPQVVSRTTCCKSLQRWHLGILYTLRRII
jgi:hypothetical protein